MLGRPAQVGLKKKSAAAQAAAAEKEEATEDKKQSAHVQRKLKTRSQTRKLDEVSILHLPRHPNPPGAWTPLTGLGRPVSGPANAMVTCACTVLARPAS